MKRKVSVDQNPIVWDRITSTSKIPEPGLYWVQTRKKKKIGILNHTTLFNPSEVERFRKRYRWISPVLDVIGPDEL